MFRWDIKGPGYEAISPGGEIKAFTSQAEANKWVREEVREAYDNSK